MSGLTLDDFDESYVGGERFYDPPLRLASSDGVNMPTKKPRFILERFDSITFDTAEEWLVKHIFPRQGVGVLYGRSQSLKSFVLAHIAMRIAAGLDVAGRQVKATAVIYIAAEGASGLRKRKVGFERACPDFPKDAPFYLIAASPNLGMERGDLAELIAAIEASGVTPGLIIIDTLAQTLGSGDENGTGMTQFIANANELARYFVALVLTAHHVGLADDQRMRGHSSLNGALDVQILCERVKGALTSTLTLQKLKDEASDRSFTVNLSRVVIGRDQDGDEISTLVVESIAEQEAAAQKGTSKPVPASLLLLMQIVQDALDAEGLALKPFGQDGPAVRAISDRAIRERYYARIAEEAPEGEPAKTLADRQRKAFNRAVEGALKRAVLVAADMKGKRHIWLP